MRLRLLVAIEAVRFIVARTTRRAIMPSWNSGSSAVISPFMGNPLPIFFLGGDLDLLGEVEGPLIDE